MDALLWRTRRSRGPLASRPLRGRRVRRRCAADETMALRRRLIAWPRRRRCRYEVGPSVHARGARPHVCRSTQGVLMQQLQRTPVITVILSTQQAWALAQFLKRAGLDDYRSLAVDVDEAYL